MRRGRKWRPEDLLQRLTRRKPPPKRPPGKGGGSETVAVEPDRPKRGEGGAAAELEFED